MLTAFLLAAAAPATPAQTVTAMFAAFNRHDPAVMARLYAPEARLISPDFCAPRGQTDVVRTYRALFDAFPDLTDTVETMVVQGDRVAVRFTASSKATGFRIPIMTFLRVDRGLIVEDDSLFDNAGRACSP